jgi:hypothetical protein
MIGDAINPTSLQAMMVCGRVAETALAAFRYEYRSHLKSSTSVGRLPYIKMPTR